mgnify:FL=1
MAKEDTFLPGQLPSFESLYGDEGKFAPDPTFEDRKRAEAEAQGLRFSGDVGIGPKFLEFVKNVPDAGYEFFARGFEGLGELAVGTALAGYKGGKLLLEPDPEKRREIMAEPAFTKYMGEFRGKLGSLDLAENTISGITPEQIANVLGYYVGPPSSVLGGIVRAPAMISKATKAAGQVGDELATTARFFPDYNPLRKFQPKSVGAMSIDELIESGQIKKGTDLTQDQGNLIPIKRTRADKVREAKSGKGIPKDPKTISLDFILNSKAKQKNQAFKILEDVRTGKISETEASKQIELIFPNKGGLYQASTNSPRRKFVELKSNYNQYRRESPKFEEDIFDKVIEGYVNPASANPQNIISVKKKKLYLDVIDEAEKMKNGESFAINFRNVFNKYRRGEDHPFVKLAVGEVYNAKQIMKALGKDPDKINLENPTAVRVSEDGTTIFQRKPKGVDFLEAWNKVKVGDVVPIGDASRYLKTTAKLDNSERSFGSLTGTIYRNPIISSKLEKTKELFENLGGEHVYAIDHIKPKLFGGTDDMDNLRFIMEGPHNTTKKLDPELTFTGESVVFNKTAFERDIYKKAKEITELVKKGNLDEAKKISEEINKLQNNFKNTYKNVDFSVGEAYIPIKTGDKTAKYVKYSEHLKLTSEQQKQVSKLIPTYENLPNKGQSIEESIDAVLESYRGISLLFPSGKIPKEFASQVSPMREGGLATMEYMTRPINAQR